MERVLRHYGSECHGEKWRCLQNENHNNGDCHFSASILNDRLTCHSQGCFKNADIFEVVGVMEKLASFKEQKEKVEELFGLDGQQTTQKKLVATYDYVNAEGQLLFQTVRYDPKDFRQRRPDGNGGWLWELGNTPRVLYRLPNVIKAQTILVLEGEKDVLTAYRLGLPEGWAATCNPMGAEKWRAEYSESLRGKKVVIGPDQDEAGQRHAAQGAQALTGVADEVRCLTLPFGKDLSEWAEQGGTAQEFHALLANVPEFCSSVAYRNTDPTEKPFKGIQVFTWGDFLVHTQEDGDGVWIIRGFLRPGWLVALIGHGKEGKTTLTLHIMASVGLGSDWVSRDIVKALPSVYIGFEMHRQDLRSLITSVSDGCTFEYHPQVVLNWPAPLDLQEFKKFLEAQPLPGVLVLDTFRGAFLLGRDGEKDAGVTGKILRTLQQIARETNWTIIVIHHSRKSGEGEFLDGSGTGEWLAVPDAVWTWTRHCPSEPGILRVTGRIEPVDDMNINLSPTSCQYLGTVPEVRKEQKVAEILRHLPGPDEDHKTVEKIREDWGQEAMAKTTLYDGLNRLFKDGKVSRVGSKGKKDPYRFRQPIVLPSDSHLYTDGKTNEPLPAQELLQPSTKVTI